MYCSPKHFTTIQVNKALEVLEGNLQSIEYVMNEIKRVEYFFNESGIKKLKSYLKLVRSNYEMSDNKDHKIQKDFNKFKESLTEISLTLSKKM